MYCFKFGEGKSGCQKCAIRYTGKGQEVKVDLPEVQSYKGMLRIIFSKSVIAKEFTIYFGELQKRILSDLSDDCIQIDLSQTNYINHFCISKILLTIYKVKKQKKVQILLPDNNKKNKMLRFLYNLGILDYIFSDKDFQCYIGQTLVSDYRNIYDFTECYDYAIFPYTIFDCEIHKDDNNTTQIEDIITKVLSSIENYYLEKNKIEKYEQIVSRVHLYLLEIIDNEFQHAYIDNAIFAVNIYNSYLPPYSVFVGTPEEKKFENRIGRLQKQVPMSVYKDIQDRYFGGFNIFIDDIGLGIQGTYESKNIENIYKDVYLNGSNKRKTINGLKLVADQISINGDILWAHDIKHWIGTSFVENNNICKQDESANKYYEHRPIRGLTYDLFINLAQNSIEKKKTYESFGCKFEFTVDEIRNIILGADMTCFSDSVFVDILNIVNKNLSFSKELETKRKFLFYRPRATQKNKIASEIETRIIYKFSDESYFQYFVVYDLNQTTLFQIKTVFENKDIASGLIKRGITKIILITEECWLFSMDICGQAFSMDKSSAEEITKMISLQAVMCAIHQNDKKALVHILSKNLSEYVFQATIYWGLIEIKTYIDIEKMIQDRAIADLFCKSIARISGMLKQEQRVVFLEKFMERKFGVLVNEFKTRAIQNIYLGSILMTGETEKRVAYDEEIKIYLFKHNECSVELKDNHFILFDLPQISAGKVHNIWRRVLGTNRAEPCEEDSEEYKYFLTSMYKKNISNISYDIGFFESGFLRINLNENLFSSYIRFVLEIIKIKAEQYDSIMIQISGDLKNINIEATLNKGISEILKSNNFRNRDKKIFIEDIEGSIQLILKIGLNLDLIEMMTEANHSKNEIVYVPLFNNMQFESEFLKIVDAGYIPFIPIYYPQDNPLVDEISLEKFKSFTRTLNPRYRKEFERKKDFIRMNSEFTNEIIQFYNHLTPPIKVEILADLIEKSIKGSVVFNIANDIQAGQYTILIYLFSLQHAITKLNNEDKTKTVNAILDFIADNNMAINDSLITYVLLVTLKSISIDYKMLEKFYDKEIGLRLLKSNATQINILFADLYSENCRLKFEAELNEFFVSNDITIYYNMLAQMLFHSEHGEIHDSKLDKIYKKLDENMGDVTDQDINDISNIVPNCISLLKLTKSYDESLIEEELLEERFYNLSFNIKENLYQIKNLITEITLEGKKRFKIIEKDDVSEGIIHYVDDIKSILEHKNYKIVIGEISNINVTIGEDYNVDSTGRLQRNIKLYKDTIIFEELAYLLHNAHAHSYSVFSINENYNQYKVWIRAELHDNCICLRLLNSIENFNGNFKGILNRIQAKKRIGKTYLEKFNIHVTYSLGPRDISCDNDKISVFETRIEIPYFN